MSTRQARARGLLPAIAVGLWAACAPPPPPAAAPASPAPPASTPLATSAANEPAPPDPTEHRCGLDDEPTPVGLKVETTADATCGKALSAEDTLLPRRGPLVLTPMASWIYPTLQATPGLLESRVFRERLRACEPLAEATDVGERILVLELAPSGVPVSVKAERPPNELTGCLQRAACALHGAPELGKPIARFLVRAEPPRWTGSVPVDVGGLTPAEKAGPKDPLDALPKNERAYVLALASFASNAFAACLQAQPPAQGFRHVARFSFDAKTGEPSLANTLGTASPLQRSIHACAGRALIPELAARPPHRKLLDRGSLTIVFEARPLVPKRGPP